MHKISLYTLTYLHVTLLIRTYFSAHLTPKTLIHMHVNMQDLPISSSKITNEMANQVLFYSSF